MDKEMFGQLVQSLKEASAIANGRAKPSRSYELKRPNVKQIWNKQVCRKLSLRN